MKDRLRDNIGNDNGGSVPTTGAIRLVVMKANPARAFWEQHGFVLTGDDELTFHMSLDPGPHAA